MKQNAFLFFLVFSFFLSGYSISQTVPSDSHVTTVVGEADRAADRQAIREHIESIFRAYVNKDLTTIRATHGVNWIGFTIGARSIIHGIDQYMQSAEEAIGNPLLIIDYKISDIDYVFYGNVALVPYIAEVTVGNEARIPGKFRSLDVYARIDGKWIQVGSNIYLHPDTVEAQRKQSISPSIPVRGVKNFSYVTSSGEKVLRLEVIIPVEKSEAWKLLATAEGWKRWAAPVVSFDLRTGGQILTNYDVQKHIGDPGTIHLPILNYIEGEMITLKVVLNEGFAEKIRKEDQNLQEIIQLVDLGNGYTKIISSMIGWGRGPEWDKTYEFFAKGNESTYKQLVALFP
jgi:hypothetical protein